MIGRSRPRARASRAPNGTSTQPRFGAMNTRPSDRRTTPATATPTPTIGPITGTRRSPASRTRRSTTSSTDTSSSGPSTRMRSSVRPPSPTMAAAIEPTRTSNASTTAPVGSGRTRGEGRPGVPRRTASPSDTKPAAASSCTRSRIALRVRPVAATSSERESGPCSWRTRRMALRFARWIVSLRWPVWTVRIRTICDPFLQTCASLPQRVGSCQVAVGPDDGRGPKTGRALPSRACSFPRSPPRAAIGPAGSASRSWWCSSWRWAAQPRP